ncbi:MAG: DnaD domain protein [Clostridia bacterium]|nr:DnaD domain protein [Clostridia bacterium]
MKLNINYGNAVISVPAAALEGEIPTDPAYLQILLTLCSRADLLCDDTAAAEQLSAYCRIPVEKVREVIVYWQTCGVLSAAEEGSAVIASPNPDAEAPSNIGTTAPAIEGETSRVQKKASVLPRFTSAETADLISTTEGLRQTLDACAGIAGKIFSEHEAAQLTALYTVYGLDREYMLLLFMYCKNDRQKTAVPYIVRTALGLYDEGVRTAAALEERIAYDEKKRDREYQIRRMFGLGERSFTTKEKEYIEAWTITWNLPMDLIGYAYEITISKIDKPSLSYVNKILSGWTKNGILTLDAAKDAQSAYTQEKEKQPQKSSAKKYDEGSESSYELSEFVALAMQRSMGGTKESDKS